MEEIEVKIKEIQDYFKQRILKGEFDLMNCGEYHVTISVEKKYPFTFWTGNGRNYCKQYVECIYPNFVYLQTENSENKQIYEVLKPHVDQYKETILKSEKLQEYLKLQKELGL